MLCVREMGMKVWIVLLKMPFEERAFSEKNEFYKGAAIQSTNGWIDE